MAELHLVQGPAGAGKSGVTAEMLSSGEVAVVADVTSLWVALSGVTRGPDGRYPVRLDDDPALHLARYVRQVAVRRALTLDINIAVTTSSPDQVEKYRALLDDSDELRARTVSIPEGVARQRLSDPATGELSKECEEAIARWFG